MSKIRSCGSLASGNNALLMIKQEPGDKADRIKELQLKKEAMRRELEELNQMEAAALSELETQPATEEELHASQKRAPPPSTKTTPVKQLASFPKKAKNGADQADLRQGTVQAVATPAPSAAASDGGSGATAEEPSASDLQTRLDQALALISDLQKKSQPATPSPSVAGTKPRPPLSAAKSMARSSPSSATTPKSSAKEVDVDVPEADDDHRSALQLYKKVDARLRRLCERKPSGKLNVPLSIHEQWVQGGKSRDELRAMLEQNDFDKEMLVCKVTKLIDQRKEESQEVLKGWFTVEMMKTELKWSASYIKDVVAYCKKHGLVKPDKYNEKVMRYFVEYSDKESTKHSRTESHQHQSTEEAESGVELANDWFQPTCSEPGGEKEGTVQTPAEGELEVEDKFADGMLTKMSKITDLISKLDSFSNGVDKDRVQKCIQALETKLGAAQEAYDEFMAVKSSVNSRDDENIKKIKASMRVAMEKASALASAEAQAKALEKSLKKKKKDAEAEAES